jgi:hypothetical protein
MHLLKTLSINLKDPKLKENSSSQHKHLFKELKEINEWIDINVRSQATKIQCVETRAKFLGGIIFPFKCGDDANPLVILGVIPELAHIFETKMRAPFKAVFEVCRLSELIKLASPRLNDQIERLDDESPALVSTPGSLVTPSQATDSPNLLTQSHLPAAKV